MSNWAKEIFYLFFGCALICLFGQLTLSLLWSKIQRNLFPYDEETNWAAKGAVERFGERWKSRWEITRDRIASIEWPRCGGGRGAYSAESEGGGGDCANEGGDFADAGDDEGDLPNNESRDGDNETGSDGEGESRETLADDERCSGGEHAGGSVNEIVNKDDNGSDNVDDGNDGGHHALFHFLDCVHHIPSLSPRMYELATQICCSCQTEIGMPGEKDTVVYCTFGCCLRNTECTDL